VEQFDRAICCSDFDPLQMAQRRRKESHLFDPDPLRLVLLEFSTFDDQMKLTFTISTALRTACLKCFVQPVRRNLKESDISLEILKSFSYQQQLHKYLKETDWYHSQNNNYVTGLASERMKAINSVSPNIVNNVGVYYHVHGDWSNKNQIEYFNNQHENKLLSCARTITLEHTNYLPCNQPNKVNFAVFFTRVNLYCNQLESIELIRCRQVHDSMFGNINEQIKDINESNPYNTPIPNFYEKLSQLRCIRLIDCKQTIVTKHLVDDIARHCNQLHEFVLTFEQLPLRYVDVFEESYGLVRLLTNNKLLRVFHVHYHGTDREPIYGAILSSNHLTRVDLMFTSHQLNIAFMLQLLNKGTCNHVGVIVKPVLAAETDLEFKYDNAEFKSLTIINNKPKSFWHNTRSITNMNSIFSLHGNFKKIALMNVHRNASALNIIAKMNPTLAEFCYTYSGTKSKKHFEVFHRLCPHLAAFNGVFLVDGVCFDQFTGSVSTSSIVHDLT